MEKAKLEEDPRPAGPREGAEETHNKGGGEHGPKQAGEGSYVVTRICHNIQN